MRGKAKEKGRESERERGTPDRLTCGLLISISVGGDVDSISVWFARPSDKAL